MGLPVLWQGALLQGGEEGARAAALHGEAGVAVLLPVLRQGVQQSEAAGPSRGTVVQGQTLNTEYVSIVYLADLV